MAGANQHYIPQALLKAFQIPGSDRRVWHFGRGEPPRRRAIRYTASKNSFYSDPTEAGDASLDAAISARESDDLSKILNAVRSARPGEPLPAADAALLAAHLTQRTAHVRSTLAEGASDILRQLRDEFDQGDGVDALLGMVSTVPTEEFRRLVMEEVSTRPELVALRGRVPKQVLERALYLLAKEQSPLLARTKGNALITSFLPKMPSLVRDAHRRALMSLTADAGGYEAALGALDWTVERGPEQGAILPDCVSVALGPDGLAGNHMLVGPDDTQALILPVSPDKLLVGRRPGFAVPVGFDYNTEAASLSHAFFLAPRSDEETTRLHATLGSRLRPSLAEASEEAVNDTISDRSGKAEPSGDAPPLGGSAPGPPPHWELALVGLDCDKDTLELVRKEIRSIVLALSKVWSLSRLDGVTVGGNYEAALQSVDRGWEGAPRPSTVPPDLGVGVAQAVPVMRSGTAKSHIVLSVAVLSALFSEDTEQRDWGLHAFARKLAGVPLMELDERRGPDALLQPTPVPEIDTWLHHIAGCAPVSYATSWMAAPIGNPAKIALHYGQQLAEGVGRLSTALLEKRRADDFNHGDLDALLEVALPTVKRVLEAAADLLGHCEGSGQSPLDGPPELRNALARAELTNWLRVYGNDLEQFRLRLGRGVAFNDFIAFNIHAERLLWAMGVLAWESDNEVMVEVLPSHNVAESMREFGGAA